MTQLLTTTVVPPARRFAFWRDAVCDTFVDLDCAATSDRPFVGRISAGRLDDFLIAQVGSRDHRVDRTAARIRRGREEVILAQIQLTGAAIVAQDGREATLGPGDFALYDSVRPYSLRFDGDFDSIVLQFPRDRLLGQCGQTERLTARAVRANTPLGSLAGPFFRQLASALTVVRSETGRQLAEMAATLVATAATELLTDQQGMASWSRTALLCRAKAVIHEHLAQADLNTGKVAAMVGISARYLQDLFHAEDMTVSFWIWSCRLEQCRRELEDPRLRGKSISRIALDAGFSHFGHFSRRFKEAYGLAPRDYRLAASV